MTWSPFPPRTAVNLPSRTLLVCVLLATIAHPYGSASSLGGALEMGLCLGGLQTIEAEAGLGSG